MCSTPSSSGADGTADHDVAAVARLLGRPAGGAFRVVVRTDEGAPAVIENEPWLADGTPMPTRYWLVDPQLRSAVSRVESAGGVRRAEAEVDPDRLARAHRSYAAARDRWADLLAGGTDPPRRRPSGGVGGTRQGVKCLHAHLAWYLAGGDDPVGAWTAAAVGLRPERYRRERAAPLVSGSMTAPSRSAAAVAALDCGTNSTRLLVVGADGSPLDRQMRITRLGEGVDATHRLAPAAIDRTVAVLAEYRQVMDRLGVGRARLVATSAARDAVNADAFFSAAADVTGVRPELLSGDEEGRLSFAGATARLPAGFRRDQLVLVVDIGGGSTELVVGAPDGSSAPQALSVDMGCVRISERYLLDDPPAPDQLAAARQAVRSELHQARTVLPDVPADAWVVGLAGTVSTLAMLAGGLTTYDRARVHHSTLARADVEHWLDRLAGEDAAARRLEPGMVEGRVDVIVGGVLVLAEVLATFGLDRCLVSEDDILDGMAASLLA